MKLCALWPVLLLSASVGLSQPEDTGPILGFASGTTTSNWIVELKPKPVKFDSYVDRVDFIHDNLHLSLQRHVVQVDTIMVDGTFKKVETPPSKFRITPYVVLKEDSGVKVSLEPDFEIEVELPNLEKRWKVFLESSRNDDLPGTDPSEQEQSGQIGIRRDKKYFRTDAGVKFRWPPVAFARVEWRTQWSVEHTVLHPKYRIFYETDEGFGTLGSFTIHRWFGRNSDMFWQSVSAGKYNTEETDGVEWEQTLKLGFVKEALENKWTWKRVLNVEDIARGHMLRYSLFSNSEDGNNTINRHRLTYFYRKPFYKKWIYLEVAPGVEAKDEDNWEIIPILTVGLDMLFWGTYER